MLRSVRPKLALRPHACVRFNRNALYLGRTVHIQYCPGLMTGSTEAVLVQPARRALAVSSVEDPVARKITVTAPGIRITGTYDWHPGQIYRFLQRASLPLPVIDAPDPNVPVLSASVQDPVTPHAQAPQLLAAGAVPLAAADDPLIPAQNENHTGLGFDSRAAPRRRPSGQLLMALDGLRQSIVGSMASGRTRCAYRLVISNSDSIRVSDSRCGSSPSSTSPVCTTL